MPWEATPAALPLGQRRLSRRWTIEDAKEIKATYKAKLKELRDGQA